MTRRTGNVDILTEDVLMIHPDDAKKNLINEGDMVCVESPRGKVDIKARITDEVKNRNSQYHFPFSGSAVKHYYQRRTRQRSHVSGV